MKPNDAIKHVEEKVTSLRESMRELEEALDILNRLVNSKEEPDEVCRGG